jgi:2-desacetyl-2-hydroxyethyl bacteriochlorophyllide A dehydrogenase
VDRLVAFRAPREVALVPYEERAPDEREVRVRTLFSGISAGTELTAYRGSNPYVTKRWDGERRLFVDGQPAFEYPLQGWGYEQVGEIEELGPGVERLKPGDVVWGVWGHKSAAVVPEVLVAERLLADAPPLAGVFARIGAVALNAVLDADIHVGEVVAVFGLGVPGLIAAQLARLNGGTVVAVDRLPRRLELARALGAAHVVDATSRSAAEEIKELTGGRGADASIELSGSYPALHEAIRATAYASRVVVAGFAQGEAAALRLGEEFHHNRIELVCSQASGVAPRLAHRWSMLRLEQTVMALRAQGRLELEPLVSHVVPADAVAHAFRLLDERPEDAVQVVLDFSGGPVSADELPS